MHLSGKQIAAARKLAGLSQSDLATAASVSDETIMRWETGQRVPRPQTVQSVRDALERRGIEFTNGDEPGVKLRPSKAIIPT